MNFNEWFKSYNGLPDRTKVQAKEHLRAAYRAGRKKGTYADFLTTEPLVTGLPASAQADMQRHLSTAFGAGRAW